MYQSYLENIDGSDYEALGGLVQASATSDALAKKICCGFCKALAVTDPERATECAQGGGLAKLLGHGIFLSG